MYVQGVRGAKEWKMMMVWVYNIFTVVDLGRAWIYFGADKEKVREEMGPGIGLR